MTSSTTSNTSSQESASGASEQVTGTSALVTTRTVNEPDDDLKDMVMSYSFHYPRIDRFDHIYIKALLINFLDIVQKLIQRKKSDDDECYIKLRAKREPEKVTIEVKSDMIQEKTPYKVRMDSYKSQIDKNAENELTINRLHAIRIKSRDQVNKLCDETVKLRKIIKAMAVAMVAMGVAMLFMALN